MQNKILTNNLLYNFLFCLLLSWFFAFCSQIIIPLPFNFVPISLQPLPLFLLSLLIGRLAVYAYFLTLFQTILGAPFFSGFQGGIAKIISPTGGYIIGFYFAMFFLALIRNYRKNSFFITLLKLLIANLILYFCGLLHLSFYVGASNLFFVGLYPFLYADLVKSLIIAFWIKYF